MNEWKAMLSAQMKPPIECVRLAGEGGEDRMVDSRMSVDLKRQAAGRAGGVRGQKRFRRHVDWLRHQLDMIGKMETGNRNKCEVYVMIREVMLEIKRGRANGTASR